MARMLAGFGLLVALALSGPKAGALDAGPDQGRRAQIAARVGGVSITVGQIEDRVASMPAFQRATYGATPAAIARTFLSDVMIPELLLELRANWLKAATKPPAAYAIERARSTSTIRAIRARIGDPSAISEAEVSAYYQKNRERFSSSARYQIWRILCKTREEAQAVLAACKEDPTPARFSALAREHSQDKGSYLRAGNLGFVAEDGSTAEPGLSVDLAVVRAVAKVRDGELVSVPIPEGDFFAVAWRRGTRPAVQQTESGAAPQIRDTVRKLRIKDETDQLVARLREAHLRNFDDGPLETADIHANPR